MKSTSSASLLALLVLLLLPATAAAQGWDYGDQASEDDESGFGGFDDGESDGGSKTTFLVTVIVCGALAFLASLVLPAISPRRATPIGRRLQVLLLLSAMLLLAFGHLLTFIAADGEGGLGAWGVWFGGAFFPGEERVSYFSGEFDELAEMFPSLNWLKIMGPALAFATLFAGLSAIPRDSTTSAVLATLAVILSFLPLLIVGIGLDKLDDFSGAAKLGTGGVFLVVAWFLLAGAPLMRFVRPITPGQPRATPTDGYAAAAEFGYTPALPAPAFAAPSYAPPSPAPARAAAARATPVRAEVFPEAPRGVPIRLVCPGCRAPIDALRGQPVRCGSCGRTGRAPA